MGWSAKHKAAQRLGRSKSTVVAAPRYIPTTIAQKLLIASQRLVIELVTGWGLAHIVCTLTNSGAILLISAGLFSVRFDRAVGAIETYQPGSEARCRA
jgi:hypothetical protein